MGDMTARPHVLILGGGFGGLTAAKALARAPVRVTLVDRTNRHTFQPLLYQVAMAGLSPAEIAQPIRAILRSPNTTVLMADATRIDLGEKRVHLDGGAQIAWDYLVFACGAETSYFGHDEWQKSSLALKSIEDAVEIRQRVLLAFEVAEREATLERRKELLSFVVIGGGPTGVELAGALAELSRFTLGRDFRAIDPSTATVRLLEAGPRILPTFPEKLAARAAEQLRELGVEVEAGARVTAIEPGCVRLGTRKIPAAVTLWAAGVRAPALTRTLGVELDPGGRVFVRRDLSVPGHADAFVIGDAARLDSEGQPLPGVSPVAMQQARAVAESIKRTIAGKERRAFEYVDKGSMATIGRKRAIAQLGRVHLSGFIAWLTWLVVHIFYLIGFKNRLVVLIVWAWSYLTYRRGARLIAGYTTTDALGALRSKTPQPPVLDGERSPRVPLHEGPRAEA
ncbi:MAG: NAD(P)/FAD-dependent oxidoreductase [Polyangiaceae bacterium]|nr:NAD(P)/FAD-dependent oxidoreductase [Polyangiaceae bacterium]